MYSILPKKRVLSFVFCFLLFCFVLFCLLVSTDNVWFTFPALPENRVSGACATAHHPMPTLASGSKALQFYHGSLTKGDSFSMVRACFIAESAKFAIAKRRVFIFCALSPPCICNGGMCCTRAASITLVKVEHCRYTHFVYCKDTTISGSRVFNFTNTN